MPTATASNPASDSRVAVCKSPVNGDSSATVRPNQLAWKIATDACSPGKANRKSSTGETRLAATKGKPDKQNDQRYRRQNDVRAQTGEQEHDDRAGQCARRQRRSSDHSGPAAQGQHIGMQDAHLVSSFLQMSDRQPDAGDCSSML